MAIKNAPIGGFARKNKKARNNMTIEDILGGISEALVAAVSYHAALCGAYFGQGTNRARSAVYWVLKLDDETEKEWANTSGEANTVLADFNQLLVETAVARGYLQGPVS